MKNATNSYHTPHNPTRTLRGIQYSHDRSQYMITMYIFSIRGNSKAEEESDWTTYADIYILYIQYAMYN
jgi:hypothetical protein